jgi:threonine dehydratase
MRQHPITLRHVFLARQTIAPLARRTPLIRSAALADRVAGAVYLKADLGQITAVVLSGGNVNVLTLLEITGMEIGG